MNVLTKLYVRFTERRGQTMAEYALIMAAVAVGGYVAYLKLGNQIATALQNVISDLSAS